MKSFETGLTRLETLTKAGRKPVHVPLAKVEDRIHAAQLVLPKQGLAALREYRREMDVVIVGESRALLRERAAYPVFLYDAQKVGITATGESDENELYPNPNVPREITKAAIDVYRQFRRNPAEFMEQKPQ